MSASPFQGNLSYDAYRIQMEAERQESFEKRIIERLFKLHNAAAWYAGLRRRVNDSAAANQLTFSWFNQRAGYPVKFKAVRFKSTRAFWPWASETPASRKRNKSPEREALSDMRDAFPERKIALITRYADWAHDVVVSNLLTVGLQQGVAYRGKDKVIVVHEGEETLVAERLDFFLERCAEDCDWRPAEAVE